MLTVESVRASAEGLVSRLLRLLSTCDTEAGLVQVLYAELHSLFGYYGVGLQVLDGEDWYHTVGVDHGVLQDVRRHRVSESVFAEWYRDPRPRVLHPRPVEEVTFEPSQGPGLKRRGRTLIWVPVAHRGRLVGAVVYHASERRPVPPYELAFLEAVHAQIGVLVRSACLNELTRNQAVRLSALNAIARALSATQDEAGVLAALARTLNSLMPVDRVQLVVPGEDGGFRVVQGVPNQSPRCYRVGRRSPCLGRAAETLARGEAVLQGDGPSSAWVPVIESNRVLAVLSVHSERPHVYGSSTLTFLAQVADQVALALRNAWAYAALTEQSRRLAVANAIGSRLASSLDRRSILRTLQEELARHLAFDCLWLLTVGEGPDGVIAEGHACGRGEVRELPARRLVGSSPAHEAYATQRPVLVLAPRPGEDDTWPGVRPARSLVWVPVCHGDRVSALISLRSRRPCAFGRWHLELLQDVATHVGLALANAEHFKAAQVERQRLQALHTLELGVAAASDEREIADAVASGLRAFMDARLIMLILEDHRGRLAGYCSEAGQPLRCLPPAPPEVARFFDRLVEGRLPIVDPIPQELQPPRSTQGWPAWCPFAPDHVVLVPLFDQGRAIGGLWAQRASAFAREEVQLLVSAAPVVGIALHTARLRRSNELALAHSVRIQEVAALAGHDLASVVAGIAEQTRTALEAVGAACWAFDDDGRVTARATSGGRSAARVLSWSGRTAARGWRTLPAGPISGQHGDLSWTLIPLWYANRLVGALGAVHATWREELPAVSDFARHAGIAIESARLAAETQGRIHTLEAVAGFADLDITRPEHARAEMGRLIERALSGADGALWLLEGRELIRISDDGDGARPPVAVPIPEEGGAVTVAGLRRSLRAGGRKVVVVPVVAEGRLAGVVSAAQEAGSRVETRRLMAVLAAQAGLVLGRLQLVAALDRQAHMMETVLRHTPVGVVLEDASGRVVFANPEVERIYGISARALVGLSTRSLLERPDVTYLSEAESEPDSWLIQLGDRGMVVRIRRITIPCAEGRASQKLTLHQDVTRRQAAAEAKDLMLRAIGHEVRSPAAAMRSTLAGLLQWGQVIDPEHRHQLVLESYRQSERLLNLVENQLLIAKLETGRFEPRPEPVPLARCVEQVLTVLRSRYGDRVDRVEAELGMRRFVASCEPTHLDQVLSNLIGNALEHTEATRVAVTARRQDGWLEVTVADDGCGLSPERRSTLFTKGAPAGQSRSRGGLGLGLYLCWLVVERSFQGRIWLDRTGPEGTVFKFTVPAAKAGARTRRG
ncbi:MAG TPA: GAF domain-containing protein [Candidatus Dormibacteraeota bacterium]|nr:GAF domain-containing protein [Candidatus Dormibacteraeota bacterium]